MGLTSLIPSLLLLVNQVAAEADLNPQAYSRNLNLNTTIALNSTSNVTLATNLDETLSSTPLVSSTPTVTSTVLPSPCHAPASCSPTSQGPLTCFGAELPYSSTGPSLLAPNTSLEQWTGLQELPGCWTVLQQLLCAAHSPSCSQGLVTKVPRAFCRAALKPCRVLEQVLDPLPDFLDCTNDRIFSDQCSEDNRSKRARFNSSTQCVAPLLHTTVPSAYFPEIEECGLQCQSPILTSAEYTSLHRTVAGAGAVSLTCSLLAVLTFLLDWRGGSKYPAVSIFWLNLCLLVAAAGWLAQFSPGAREDIVCRRDGTTRHAEPGQGENISCTVVFVLVYYFSIAAAVWLVILAYCWSVAFTSTPGKVQDILAGRAATFHMAAWSLPLVLTLIVLFTNKVDGSAATGICFVGYTDRLARTFFVLVPHSLATLAAGYFTFRSCSLLASLCYGPGSKHLSEAAASKLRSTLARILAFSVLTTVCVVTTLGCHAYRWAREHGWQEQVSSLVLCNLRRRLLPEATSKCRISEGPSLAVLQLELLAVFGAGVLASSWVWTRESLNTWSIGVRQLVCREQGQRPVKLRKHEIIAQVGRTVHFLVNNYNVRRSRRGTSFKPMDG